MLPKASIRQHNVEVQKYRYATTAHLYHLSSGQCKKWLMQKMAMGEH